MLIFAFFCFFFITSLSAAEKPAVDLLVLSPHPDDETLCCAGTILKAVQDNKKVKIVFLTNGDADSEAVAVWTKKKPQELSPEDYIAFGEERQREALQAAKKLGLKEKDVIFFSYPNKGLSYLWKKEYNQNYKSPATGTFFSPYRITYKRAKEGYNRENLFSDIEGILREYKPKNIYTPHPSDTHLDHQATTLFLNLALEKLRQKAGVSYYLIHSPASREPFIFSQKPSRSEDAAYFEEQKKEILNSYATQLNVKKEKDFFENFIKDKESFWDIPVDKESYLVQLQDEWVNIAEYMHANGYNVNFAPAVDVAGNIEDTNHPLVKKQRMYSEDPQIVTELASAAIRGLLKGKIIPVVKHFPGLGRVYSDTHLSLPALDISKTELYNKNLLPFREIIKRYPDVWIMVDHAIYTSLSNKPASLSYEAQTELLRKALGFKGIIVVDELLSMQAMKEYAFGQELKEPYIGEIVLRAFQAGADIAIVFPSPDKTEEVASYIINTVKQAVEKNSINEKDIDDSVKRILKEKEKIFAIPLEHLLKDMSIEEKICQKLIFDCNKDTGIFKKYNLGGMYYLHDNLKIIDEAQDGLKIPMFIVGQHEGGIVSQYGISTRSAYVMGKEFARTRQIEIQKDKSKIRVLCLATHPDDEDGEALVYFGKKLNCATYVLLATQGEGGRNKISSALYEELGLLRTEEMKKSASILGVKKVYYLGKTDFGYTASIDETIEKWGREDSLEKLVYFIRLIKPHIIITKHNEFNPDEHGQHRALVILAKEAFDLAGNPEVYPEMIKEGLLSWQPLKFFQRSTSNKEDIADNEFKIDPAEYIAPEKKTIHQIAFDALTQHRSQSDWEHLRINTTSQIRFELLKSNTEERNEF